MRAWKLIRRAGVLSCGSAVAGMLLLVWDGTTDELGRADAGLVLGNTVHEDGTPSARLRARLDQTLKLYLEGYYPLVIVSGGLGKEGHDEALVMRDYLLKRGVPAHCIIVDSEGLTTWASAMNTRRFLVEHNGASVLVVSQYFHVPRSKLALKRLGVKPVFSSHARFFELRDFYSVPRELLGWISYRFRKAPSSA